MWYSPKTPYNPWKVDNSDFPSDDSIEAQVKFLLNYAVLAPSTFNIQPWLFLVSKGKVSIFPDFSRKLITSDKSNRLLYISLGCAVKNFELAALHFGFSTNFEIIKKVKGTLIEIKLKKINNKIHNAYLNAIKNRLTNRNLYSDKGISDKFLAKIDNIVEKHNLKLLVSTDSSVKEKLINLTEKADYTLWSDDKFKNEHLKWIRNNMTKRHDGMPAFTVGIPLLASFFADFAIRNFNYAKIQAEKNKLLLKSTPYFSFILSNNHDVDTWIQVGRALEEIWIESSMSGISLAPQAQIIEVSDYYKDTMKIIGSKLRPQLFFRLGYPSKPSFHSPRRSVNEVLIGSKKALSFMS